MSRATTLELDFFAMEKNNPSNSGFRKLFPRQRSFRDIQSAISKINPELLKSVIASGFGSNKSPLLASSTPKEEQSPVIPTLGACSSRNTMDNLSTETAPLTIFYNGTVAVFDVGRDKAETILKLAEKGMCRTVKATCTEQNQLLQTLNNGDDMPIARRKSLQKFLEKRKERLTCVAPYTFSSNGRV